MKTSTIQKISAREISVHFGAKKVIDRLNFEIPEGFSRVTSTSGGGKSVILRLLAGSLAPDSGELYLNDRNVSDFTFEEWSPYRLKIGYSFDFGGLLSNRTLFENLLLPLHYHNILEEEQAYSRVEELLMRFDLFYEKDLRPSEVTGSQRKAACVARSMIMHPEVLLLDEPTIGLNQPMKKALFEEVETQMRDSHLKFVIFCSDDPEMLKRFQHKEIHCRRLGSQSASGEAA